MVDPHSRQAFQVNADQTPSIGMSAQGSTPGGMTQTKKSNSMTRQGNNSKQTRGNSGGKGNTPQGSKAAASQIGFNVSLTNQAVGGGAAMQGHVHHQVPLKQPNTTGARSSGHTSITRGSQMSSKI